MTDERRLQEVELRYKSTSAAATQRLGEMLGHRLNREAIIALNGDLGSGKTCFVQGLALGLQVPRDYYITSPTFTIVNEYPGRLRLIHVDLYRLQDSATCEDIGWDDILDVGGVVAVEWAERFSPDELEADLTVDFLLVDDTVRSIAMRPLTKAMGAVVKKIEKEIEETPWP